MTEIKKTGKIEPIKSSLPPIKRATVLYESNSLKGSKPTKEKTSTKNK